MKPSAVSGQVGLAGGAWFAVESDLRRVTAAPGPPVFLEALAAADLEELYE